MPRFSFEVPWPQDDGGNTDMVFVGEDGYAGYIALIQDADGNTHTGGNIRGVIIRADLPAVPEPWSAE